MSDGTILSRVIAITANHANIVADQVNPDAAFTEAPLSFDSLDRIELAMLFAEEFGIPFPDADVDNPRCGTPAGVAVYIKDAVRDRDAHAETLAQGWQSIAGGVSAAVQAKRDGREAYDAARKQFIETGDLHPAPVAPMPPPLIHERLTGVASATPPHVTAMTRPTRTPAPNPAPLTGEPTPQQIRTPTVSNRTTERAELTPILHQPFAPPAAAPDGFGWTDMIEILHQGFVQAERAPFPTRLIIAANGVVVQTLFEDYWSHHLVSWQEIVFSNTPIFKDVIAATNAAVLSGINSIEEIPQ